MIEIRYSKRFFRSAKKLAPAERQRLATLLELLEENPFHPLLHAKSLEGQLSGVYSFRITRNWRALFRFATPEIVCMMDIGNRKDIYR